MEIVLGMMLIYNGFRLYVVLMTAKKFVGDDVFDENVSDDGSYSQ